MSISVFHYIGTDRYTQFDETAFAGFPSAYRRVAEVDTASLDKAFQLTNSIDGDWWANPNVTTTPLVRRARGARSTSVGDVLVKDGVAYGVARQGFTVLPSIVSSHWAVNPRLGLPPT